MYQNTSRKRKGDFAHKNNPPKKIKLHKNNPAKKIVNYGPENDETKRKKICLICMDESYDIIDIHKNHFSMCTGCTKQQGNELLLNNDLLPWKCPGCEDTLPLDILKNFMDDEKYNKLLTRTVLNSLKDTISCPGCDNTYIIEKEDKKLINFKCNICNEIIYLIDMTKEIQDVGLLHNLANMSGWKQCPGCDEMIERSSGCNLMTHKESDGSDTMFCYQCGDKLTKDNAEYHYPTGSYNDCINAINNHTTDIGSNDDSNYEYELDSEPDYHQNYYLHDDTYFSTESDTESDTESNSNILEYEMDINYYYNGNEYHCAFCKYSSTNPDSLYQHMNSKDHYLSYNYHYNYCKNGYIYNCPSCSYNNIKLNPLIHHMKNKGHHDLNFNL